MRRTPIFANAKKEITCRLFTVRFLIVMMYCVKFVSKKLFKSFLKNNAKLFFLKIYAQLTFQEIADTLDISANTAGSRYRYAMEKLSEFLGDKKNGQAKS